MSEPLWHDTARSSEHDQPHIRSPLVAAAPISRLRRDGLRNTTPFLNPAFQAMRRFGSSTWIPRPDRVLGDYGIWFGRSSDGLEHGAFDDNTGGHIFPQRNQQLSRQRHNSRLLETA